MDDNDERIIALISTLREHDRDVIFNEFMILFHLLYERAKEGCLCDEEAQIYRQQGAAIAMRDLILSLKEG